MNNCATRTVLSGVMGMGLGVLFGIVMGSMDSAVPPFPLQELSDVHSSLTCFIRGIVICFWRPRLMHACDLHCHITVAWCLQGVGMTGSMAPGAETQTIRQAATQMLKTVRSRSWCAVPIMLHYVRKQCCGRRRVVWTASSCCLSCTFTDAPAAKEAEASASCAGPMRRALASWAPCSPARSASSRRRARSTTSTTPCMLAASLAAHWLTVLGRRRCAEDARHSQHSQRS